MNSRDIIQARIDELEQELKSTVQTMQDTQAPESKDEQFKLVSGFKDKVLTLRAGIAELKNIKELV